MAETYTKLFSSITLSTIWRESHTTRIVWITMLALADKHGYVGASVPGLADASRVTVAECEAALSLFMAPDPYSRSKDFDGRRIEAVDRGWNVLNHDRYRDMRDEDVHREVERDRKRRQRASQKHSENDTVCPDGPAMSRDVPACPAMSSEVGSQTQIRSEEEKRATEVAAPSVKPAKKQNPALVALKAAMKRHIEVPPALSNGPALKAAARLQAIIDAGHAADLDGAADCLVLAAVATDKPFPWCLMDAKPAPKKTDNSLNQRPGWMP